MSVVDKKFVYLKSKFEANYGGKYKAKFEIKFGVENLGQENKNNVTDSKSLSQPKPTDSKVLIKTEEEKTNEDNSLTASKPLSIQKPFVATNINESIKEKFVTKGLLNIGNTCYMNTALQIFINIPGIFEYFLDNKDKWKEGSFCKIMAEFIKAYRNSKLASEHLRQHLVDIKNFVASKVNYFEGYDQKDSPLFFISLLIIIQDETKQCLTDLEPDMREITGCDKELHETYLKHGKQLWENYYKYKHSIITQKFDFMRYDKLICLENESHSFIKFDVFSTISFPIPSNEANRVTLDDCFKEYTKRTQLKDYCEFCKMDCLETTRFLNLPDILFLQLPRCKSFKDKIVDFPLEMNLSKYVDDKTKTWNYKLIAFADHIGSLTSGHYIANIRDLKSDDDKWHYLSDSHIEEVNNISLSSNIVHYLVYERINTETV